MKARRQTLFAGIICASFVLLETSPAESLRVPYGEAAPKRGQFLEFQQTSTLKGENMLEAIFRIWEDGQWQKFHPDAPDVNMWHRKATVTSDSNSSDRSTQASPLAPLQTLVGTWKSQIDPRYKEHPRVKRFDPELKGNEMVLQWGLNKEVIHVSIFYSDRPAAGQKTLFIEGMILWNPAEKKAIMVEYNAESDLLFEGEYEVVEGGDIKRTYIVSFSDGTKRKFRDHWKWEGTDRNRFKWITESFTDGQFVAGDVVVTMHRVK